MNYDTYFTFRCSPEERKMIHELADKTFRSESSVMRLLVHSAYVAVKNMDELEANENKVNTDLINLG